MFGVKLGRAFKVRNGKIDYPQGPLSARSGSSAPKLHRFKAVLNSVAITFAIMALLGIFFTALVYFQCMTRVHLQPHLLFFL